MALFSVPGGAEWLIIMLMVGLLFVPGVVVFWLGYLTGRNGANRQATVAAVTTEALVEDKDA